MPGPYHDWNALRLAYVHGTMTLEAHAGKHGIKPGTMRARASREGWAEQRAVAERSAVQQAAASLSSARRQELIDFNKVDLATAKAIRAMVSRRLLAARNDENPLSTADLQRLGNAAAAAQKIGRLALGVSTDNHGHGGPNGEGPVPLARVPVGEYAAALKAALEAF